MVTTKFFQIVLVLLVSTCVIPTNNALSYDSCDEYSIPASTKASDLTPNVFHKICPGTFSSSSSSSFSSPICGDGTPFAFFFTRPTKRKMNSEKLLIEFMGGGACWDADTCDRQQGYLTFPEKLNNFIGLSCSEISYGGGNNINMLCSEQVGSVDFSEYNTVVVPYCTQDVHAGDNTVTYDDGSVVNHSGAANMMAVMDWIKTNFPNPSHIVLTGCSAGGTAIPVAYDLLNMHYNRLTRSPPGMKAVQISSIVDSAVYLTPTYFLYNALDNWNVAPIMKKINFPYNRYKHKEEYSTLIWQHTLKRGPNSDKWGFITHTSDPVSEKYYQYMGGTYGDDDAVDEDLETAWWNSLSSSLTSVEKKHKNVDTFYIDGEGHCTFGWYYALQEDGFVDWAHDIVEEKALFGRTTAAVPLFLTALALGAMITVGTLAAKKKKRDIDEVDDGVLLEGGTSSQDKSIRAFRTAFGSCLLRFQDYPVMAGYFFFVSFYFFTMLLKEGFEHPIDNPSLGPSAASLSRYGIMNPTLFVYQSDFFRLFTSGFLCSGVLTYFVVAIGLIRHARYIEQAFQDTKTFFIVCLSILVGCNLIYACIMDGASCASVSLILGLNALSIILKRRATTSTFPKPTCWTITILLLTTYIFPFNNWVNSFGGVAIGVILGLFVLEIRESAPSGSDDIVQKSGIAIKKPSFGIMMLAYVIMFGILAFRVRRPNEIYTRPFLTGCDLSYAEVSADVAGSFYGDRRLRVLEEDDDAICVEVCVPHIVARPLVWGASSYFGYSVGHGLCEENGYTTHVADKTFTKATYSVDVQVFTSANDDDE